MIMAIYAYRDISGIKGFTREVLIALCADIESREWRYKVNSAQGIPPPHARSCTTDDVECFFSVLRDSVGKDFTLKQVHVCVIICCTSSLHTLYTQYGILVSMLGLVWMAEGVCGIC